MRDPDGWDHLSTMVAIAQSVKATARADGLREISRKPRFGRNNVYFKLRRTGAADDFCRSLARGMTTMSKEARAVTTSSGDAFEILWDDGEFVLSRGVCARRTLPTPRRHALIGAALTRNPRAAATRLCVARGARSCLGRPALTAGASPRATYVVERGPWRRVPVEAHGAAVGDCVVSAPRHRHRYGACSGSSARPHP